MQIYRVNKNQDVYAVAQETGVSPIKLAEHNSLSTRGALPNGRELLVIIPTRTYNARSGDSIESIANRFGVSGEELLRMNPELCGRDKLYSGQVLTVKEDARRYGMISTNGYMYEECTRDRLIAIMPYLTYVTVCAAAYRDGGIRALFHYEESVELIKSYGRAPIIRIYLEDIPHGEECRNFISSMTVMARSGGFAGVALSQLGGKKVCHKDLDALIFTARRALMEADLLLFAEGDCDSYSAYMEYADAGVLTYDKLHLADIPSFENGEARALRSAAEAMESARIFIEISSFAYSSGKYIEKSDAMRITDRKRADIPADDERKICAASYGRGGRHRIIYESLENTKAKLELISELGFMGVAFDIRRICTCDIMMIESAYRIISNPLLPPRCSEIG